MTPRPPEFDQKVLSFLPFLNRLASKRARTAEEHDDLVQESVILALSSWHTYREPGNFCAWLGFVFRNAVTKYRGKGDFAAGHVTLENDDNRIERSCNPSQEAQVDLARVSAAILGIKDGDVLLRHAAGETYSEIGASFGVTRQRIEQRVAVARECMRARGIAA